MKLFFGALTLFICMVTSSGNASSNEKGSRSSFGFSAGPIFKINGCGSGVLASLGGRLNASYGYLVFGLGGYGVVAQSDLKIQGLFEKVSYSYGGLGVGVRLFPNSFIHLTNYNTFGLGHVQLKNRGESAMAYSVEPELNAEIDIFSLVRIGAGLSYRFVFSDKLKVPSSAISGLGGQIFVEFGHL